MEVVSRDRRCLLGDIGTLRWRGPQMRRSLTGRSRCSSALAAMEGGLTTTDGRPGRADDAGRAAGTQTRPPDQSGASEPMLGVRGGRPKMRDFVWGRWVGGFFDSPDSRD